MTYSSRYLPGIMLLSLPAWTATSARAADRELIPSPTDPVLYQEAAWTIVVFLVFFAVLSLVVWPKILAALKAREEKEERDLVAAESAAKEAKETLAQYKQQLAEAQRESQRIIEQSRSDAQRIGAELKEQAQADINQMRQRAEQDIANAKQQAIVELHAHAAELATTVAGRILKREIKPDDHETLIRDSLNELSRAHRN